MKTKWETVGQIGVDAGICWIGDPCYILHQERELPKSIGKDWNEFCDKLHPEGKEDTLDTWQFDTDLNSPILGVVVSTGWGDGVYPVEIKRDAETGRVAEVRVKFI